MNGFVKSRRGAGVYCMKRHINPGQKVSLDELYEQYGVSHDISPGPEFVRWLRTVKLRRRDIWEIVFNDMSITTGNEPFEALRKAEEERRDIETAKQIELRAIETAKQEILKAEEEKNKEPESCCSVEDEHCDVCGKEPEVEEKPVVEEVAKVEEKPLPEAQDDTGKAEKAEAGEDRSGKLILEGDINVDDSGGMSFSFPSAKKNMVPKEISERNKQLYGSRITAPKGVKKSVRSRVLDEDKPKITPADILELKVNDLDKIDKVDDLKILKIALKKAEDMRSKATVCKRLKKRIVKLKPRSRYNSV